MDIERAVDHHVVPGAYPRFVDTGVVYAASASLSM